MNKIASFTIDHLKLLTGVYVSRKDCLKSDVLTTFDLRITRPNLEPVMDNAGIHAFEHLGATFLRNDSEWGNKVVYFGPMGCRTGFYLILAGDLEPKDIVDLLKRMLTFITEFEGDIPGASAVECGNYLELNLSMAKYYANKYLKEVFSNVTEDRLVYPSV